jgi:hypothetical protein
MERVEIRLKSQPALLGLETKKTKTTMRREPPLVRMERTAPTFEIERTGPKLVIEQTKVWEEIGTGGPLYLTEQQKILGQAGAIEAIGRISQEGDFLAAIENPNNTIAELAAQLPPTRESNVALIPKSRPSARVEGELKINWKPGKLKREFTGGKVEIDYEPSVVKAYLRQYHYLKVWTVNRTGMFIDWQVE